MSDSYLNNKWAQDARSVFEFIRTEYLDRDFKSTIPSGSPPPHMRDLKRQAIKKYYSGSQGKALYNEKSAIDQTSTHENNLAYELCIAISRIGLVALYGGFSVRLLFSITGDQLVEDWPLCYHWLSGYRKKEPLNFHPEGTVEIPFHRRHGECIALLAALWMKKNFKVYRPLQEIELLYEPQKGIDNYCRALLAPDKPLIPMPTWNQIKELTGIDLR